MLHGTKCEFIQSILAEGLTPGGIAKAGEGFRQDIDSNSPIDYHRYNYLVNCSHWSNFSAIHAIAEGYTVIVEFWPELVLQLIESYGRLEPDAAQRDDPRVQGLPHADFYGFSMWWTGHMNLITKFRLPATVSYTHLTLPTNREV